MTHCLQEQQTHSISFSFNVMANVDVDQSLNPTTQRALQVVASGTRHTTNLPSCKGNHHCSTEATHKIKEEQSKVKEEACFTDSTSMIYIRSVHASTQPVQCGQGAVQQLSSSQDMHMHTNLHTYVCLPTQIATIVTHECTYHTHTHHTCIHHAHIQTHTTHVYTTHTHRHTQQCTHMQQCLCNHRDHTSTIGDFPITTVYIAAHLKKAHRSALVWLALLLLSFPPPPRLSKGR